MEATFIAKLLAVVDSNRDPTSYTNNLQKYKEQLSYTNLNKASQDFEEKQIPIPPEMQLVFNLEVILKDVYKRAKADAQIEIIAQLEMDRLSDNKKEIKVEEKRDVNKLLTFDDI